MSSEGPPSGKPSPALVFQAHASTTGAVAHTHVTHKHATALLPASSHLFMSHTNTNTEPSPGDAAAAGSKPAGGQKPRSVKTPLQKEVLEASFQRQ